jgi:CheY-like chemotaxis protein
MALPMTWIAFGLLTSLLAFRLTGQDWLAFAVIILGMLAATRHAVKRITDLRAALHASEAAREKAGQDRSALESALRQAQRMEALGRLAVGAAHDLNNHLTVISSNVELLARRLDPSQERLLRHTDAAMQGVQRAAALTGRLLSFSHQPAPDPEAVDVSRLLTRLSDLLRRTLGHRIGLEVILPDTPWLTWADVNQMENALLSLTVNARDKVRHGAKLTIEVTNLRLPESSQPAHKSVKPGEYIQIEVRNSAEAMVWIAADDANSADVSIACAFVRNAAGHLLRSGESDSGMSLRLLLPRYAPPVNAASRSRGKEDGRPTVLVVEDDPAVRSACVEILRDLNYRVLEAPDAMEAFRLIADHGGIDLLFTDLGLPGGVSGRALADAARNVDADIRVLFTTGYEHAETDKRSGTAVLRKPFSREQLAAMVHDVLAETVSDGAVPAGTAGVPQMPAAPVIPPATACTSIDRNSATTI